MTDWFEDDFLQTWLWVRSEDGGEWVGREEEPKSVLISACEGKNALLLYLNLMFHEWAFVYSGGENIYIDCFFRMGQFYLKIDG